MSAYKIHDLLIYDEWTMLGADAVEECLEALVYGLSQRDYAPTTCEAYTKEARRRAALASLWWLTGWDVWPEMEVE